MNGVSRGSSTESMLIPRSRIEEDVRLTRLTCLVVVLGTPAIAGIFVYGGATFAQTSMLFIPVMLGALAAMAMTRFMRLRVRVVRGIRYLTAYSVSLATLLGVYMNDFSAHIVLGYIGATFAASQVFLSTRHLTIFYGVNMAYAVLFGALVSQFEVAPVFMIGIMAVFATIHTLMKATVLGLEHQALLNASRNRAIIAAIPDTLVRLDPNLEILDCKAPEGDHLFPDPTLAIGMPALSLLPEDIRELIDDKLRQAREGDGIARTDLAVQGPEATHHYECRFVPVGNGETLIIFHEITHRKRDEERLRSSEALFHTTINAIGDWIHVVDRELRIRYLNRALLEKKGRLDLPTDVVGHTMREAYPWLPEKVIEEYDDVFRTGVPMETVDTSSVNGLMVVTETRKWPVYDGDDVIRVVTVTRDITELKQTEEALRQAKDFAERLFRVSPSAIFTVDLADRVTSWNDRAAEVTGYGSDEVLGQLCSEFMETSCSVTSAIQVGGAPLPVSADECSITRKDGALLTVLRRSDALRGPSGEVIGAIESFEDVTESKRAFDEAARKTHELREFTRRLELSNRELKEFAYAASHDLQEPLRKVTAFGQRVAARAGDALDETARDYLARMMNAAERMQVLIEALLQYSRVTTKVERFQRVDLDAVVGEVITDLEVAIESSGAEVEIEGLPTLSADPVQMRQLFQNLIGNAIKFRRPDVSPRVRITASQVGPNGSAQEIIDADRRTWEVTVRDNGVGFEPRHAERIFAVFPRLHSRSEYEGTGVGLAICRKIVERHNGVITAEGEPGVGAAFMLRLPQSPPEEEGA